MNYGINYVVEMCKEFFESGYVYGLYLYILNCEMFVLEILKKFGMC